MEIIRAGGFAEYLAGTVGTHDGDGLLFEQRLCAALQKLGVARRGEILLSYEEWHNYERRGAETYVAAAQVVVAGPHGSVARPFVSKAILHGHPTARRMLNRRALLASWGVPVPHLYSAVDACIVEQFVPYSLHDCLTQGQAHPQVLHDVIHAAAVLDLHGFPALSFMHDMRADGRRAYYVDFGWDLWDPSGRHASHAYPTLLAFVDRHMPGMRREVERRYRLACEHARQVQA